MAEYKMRMAPSVKAPVRWFVAQFVVVVLGVLAALAVDAWRERKGRESGEKFYLRQLHAELTTTESAIARSLERVRGSVHASSRLLRAFKDPQSIPVDSIRIWSGRVVWYGVPAVNLGVARALVSGELPLFADDSLRTALPILLDRAETFRASQYEVRRSFVAYSNELRSKVPYSDRLALLAATDSTVAGSYEELPYAAQEVAPFRVDYEALLQDREAYVIIDGLYDYASDLLRGQRFMLQSVAELRSLVESRLKGL